MPRHIPGPAIPSAAGSARPPRLGCARLALRVVAGRARCPRAGLRGAPCDRSRPGGGVVALIWPEIAGDASSTADDCGWARQKTGMMSAFVPTSLMVSGSSAKR
jgi:hypothetical protein